MTLHCLAFNSRGQQFHIVLNRCVFAWDNKICNENICLYVSLFLCLPVCVCWCVERGTIIHFELDLIITIDLAVAAAACQCHLCRYSIQVSCSPNTDLICSNCSLYSCSFVGSFDRILLVLLLLLLLLFHIHNVFIIYYSFVLVVCMFAF